MNFDHSSPVGAQVKNEWRYTSGPSICLYAVEVTTLRLPLPNIRSHKFVLRANITKQICLFVSFFPSVRSNFMD
jgi:hypothetical protein